MCRINKSNIYIQMYFTSIYQSNVFHLIVTTSENISDHVVVQTTWQWHQQRIVMTLFPFNGILCFRSILIFFISDGISNRCGCSFHKHVPKSEMANYKLIHIFRNVITFVNKTWHLLLRNYHRILNSVQGTTFRNDYYIN